MTYRAAPEVDVFMNFNKLVFFLLCVLLYGGAGGHSPADKGGPEVSTVPVLALLRLF